MSARVQGEVYRARDTKLDRDVAIKVLPEEFALDKERSARFEREAKLLASLNHPNIASIHGFKESNGVKALVLELVEGPTLAERIAKGPIPVDESIAIAKQIAEALEAGHEAGVIHRDLKPANIKLKEDGTVKVLDYGLAKALEREASSGADPELSQSPTLTRQGTQIGVILGTAAYMSPEQAKGKRVDHRTDVWAFGAVLYEMLTGRRAFAGDDVSDTLAAVLRAEPDFGELLADTPARVRRLLGLCLTKSAKDRLQAVGDARLEMAGAFDATAREPTSPSGVHLSLVAAATAVLLFSLATGLLVWRMARPAAVPAPITRFSIQLPEEMSMTDPGRNRDIAFSADGRRLAYVANRELYVHDIETGDATPVRGTENITNPVFSPDGDWIAFSQEGQIKKVVIPGGVPAPRGSLVRFGGRSVRRMICTLRGLDGFDVRCNRGRFGVD
jgi:serine/threonine-protein kinase